MHCSYSTTAIGQFGYEAGPNVYILDQFGLADPLTARADVSETGWRLPAGHRKQLDLEWYAARFDAPAVLINREVRPDAVAAARRALACPPLSDLLDAVSEPLTVGRFLSNVRNSMSFARLRLPIDPLDARPAPCEPP